MTNISDELLNMIQKLDQKIQHVTSQVQKIKQRTNDPIIISHSLPNSWEKLIAAKVKEKQLENNLLLTEQLKQTQQRLVELENITIPHLQSKIQALEDQLSLFQKYYSSMSAVQPIVFQEFSIDRVFLDKYEQTNNLGQLGIRELNGKLHIGAVYPPHFETEKNAEDSEQAKTTKEEDRSEG
ncbi:hypothetical protein MKZ02_18235 [Pseudobacillus sp. FSL P4-0506]|uniref:hypothetical protein n=1 Tax=unclassified Pseudobacillus TaxID=2619284 RepID=UPI0030F6B899